MWMLNRKGEGTESWTPYKVGVVGQIFPLSILTGTNQKEGEPEQYSATHPQLLKLVHKDIMINVSKATERS